MTLYAKIPIMSNFTNIGEYATVGAEITILSYTKPIYICEYQGKRFSCHEGKLGDRMPVAVEEIKAIVPQLSLF